jgi:tetratricopeptide (TPR) repeat protein
MGDVEAALAGYEASAAATEESGLGKGWAYGNLAAFQQRLGMQAEAAQNYVRALNAEPDDPVLHARLGDLYFQMGEVDKSLQQYEEALEHGEDLYYVYASYGGVLYQLGEYEQAVPIYEKSLELRPVDFPVLFNLAQVYEFLGEVEKARQLYARILELEGNFSAENVQLARERLEALAPP